MAFPGTIAELKAANTVRRAIQKVRMATPDNFEQLEAAVFDCMEQQIAAMGAQHEKVQEEIERGLDFARQRVAQLEEKRQQDAESAVRPSELMEEMRVLLEVLEGKLVELREATCLDGGSVLQGDQAEAARKVTEHVSAEIKAFSQQCMTHVKEIQAAKLPDSLRPAYTALANSILEVKRRGEMNVAQARMAIKKATEGQRREMLEEKKKELGRKVEEAKQIVPAAEQYVISAEMVVEPFIRGKRKEEAELTPLCQKAEEAVVVAQSSVDAARSDVQPPAVEDVSPDLKDPDLRRDIEAFLAEEYKVPQVRLGQLEKRIKRVTNIVSKYRKDLRTARNKVLFASMKDELVEKVKATGEDTGAIEGVDPLISAAEKGVEPLFKRLRSSVPEMRALAEQAAAAIDTAMDSFQTTSFEVMPIDPALDDDLRRKLRDVAAPHARQPLLLLGQRQRRLRRCVNLLETFRCEVSKKRRNEFSKVQASLLRLFRHRLGESGADAETLFVSLANGGATISKAQFLSFVRSLDKVVRKEGSQETEEVHLPEAEVEALFDAQANGAGLLDQARFRQLASPRLRVARATPLTSGLAIAGGRSLRQLRAGEDLEALEGPAREEKVGVMRVRVRAQRDGKVGWATLAGNAGTVFLKECGPI